jgi:precorrin-4 methylase
MNSVLEIPDHVRAVCHRLELSKAESHLYASLAEHEQGLATTDLITVTGHASAVALIARINQKLTEHGVGQKVACARHGRRFIWALQTREVASS